MRSSHFRSRLLSSLPFAAVLALLAVAWMERTHSLKSHGRWTPTKITVARSLLGAESYWEGPQALAGGLLGLGAWHGFQEVVLDRPVTPRALDVDFSLTRGSYFVSLIYDEAGEVFSAVRLSRDGPRPSRLLRGSRSAGFRWTDRVRPGLLGAGPHALSWRFAGSAAQLELDGEPIGSVELPGDGPYRIGLRGGWANVYVDGLRLSSTDGTIRDGFELPPHWLSVVAAAALAGLVLAFGAQVLLGRRSLGPGLVAAYFAMVGITAMLLAGMLCGYAFHRSREPHYPPGNAALARREAEVIQEHVKVRRKEVMAAYHPPPPPGATRVLLLGSSQTWGSGALRESETVAAQLQTELNTEGDGRLFQVINGGISGTRSSALALLWERAWAALEPDVLVVNLGNNDKDGEKFVESLEKIATLGRQRGTQLLFVLEANSPERSSRGLVANHRLMLAVAERFDVPLVPMDTLLRERQDEGFLWWDKVHLTSFGQGLMAEELAPHIRRLPPPAG